MATGTATRVATVISKVASGVSGALVSVPRTPTTQVPLRMQQFTAAQFSNHEELARQLNQMQTQFHDATLPARSYPRTQGIIFEDNSVTPGLEFTLHHGLGHKVYWSIVRWRSAALAVVSLIEMDQTNETITLHSSTSGIVDVEVF